MNKNLRGFPRKVNQLVKQVKDIEEAEKKGVEVTGALTFEEFIEEITKEAKKKPRIIKYKNKK